MRVVTLAAAVGLGIAMAVGPNGPAAADPHSGPTATVAPQPPPNAAISPDTSTTPGLGVGGQLSDGDGSVNITVVGTGSTPGSSGRESGLVATGPAAPRRQCELVSFPSPGTAGGQDLAALPAQMSSGQIAAHRPATLVPGQTYARYCTNDGQTWDLAGGFVFQPGNPTTATPPVPVVAPRVLAEQALANIHVPDPRIGTAPPYRKDSLVGIDTWLWVDPTQWHPLTATATVGPLSVTATATPVLVTWDMGEGHHTRPTTCTYPGTVYNTHIADNLQHTHCAYTFQWASWDHRTDTPGTDHDDLYHAHATIAWQITWDATDGEFGSLTNLTSATAFDLRVEDLQAVVCEDTPLGHCHPPTTAPTTGGH